MIKVFITPIKYLEFMDTYNSINFILLHMAIASKKYRKFYTYNKKYKILDNSAYELGKPLSVSEILDYAGRMRVDEIIMPDKLQNSRFTIRNAKKFIDVCPKKYNLMGVIQGHDMNSWMKCFRFMNTNRYVGVLGISKFGVPFPTSDYYVNRMLIYNLIKNKVSKPIHFLGAVDIRDWIISDSRIRSCDSKLLFRLANKKFSFYMDNVDKFKLMYLLNPIINGDYNEKK